MGATRETARVETHRFRFVGVCVDGLPHLDGLVLTQRQQMAERVISLRCGIPSLPGA